MKTPAGTDIVTAGLRIRRLVKLLKGQGLDKTTVAELLAPESLSALKGILTDRLFPDPAATRER